MRRREFIAGLGSMTTWPVVSRAQKVATPVVGVLFPGRPDADTTLLTAYLHGLKEGGYAEGRNVAIEYRWSEGHNDRFPALAADLVRRQVRVILAGGAEAALAAKSATTTIPIVFQTGIDPVKAGLVTSLNRPAGNVTGVSNTSAAIVAKRLELLHQLIPKAAAIGILVDPTDAITESQNTQVREAATSLGLRLILLNASNEQEIDAAFMALVQQRIGALLLSGATLFTAHREQLVTLARFNAIPTMYTFREFAVAGGLISYAADIRDARRRAGDYVARVLNGEKPGDLPVQLPTKYELVINLKTAKALGLTIPETLSATADEVIQ
jgi:putative tryptophan/tyrosine transport system substrate-binding protein